MGVIFSSSHKADLDDTIGLELRRDEALQRAAYPRSDGQSLILSDGRTLGYAVYGAPDATEERTILFLHGTPGTRFFWHEDHSVLCENAGIRVVLPERPGFGLSSPQRARSLLSHADDLTHLLDHLNIGKVTVMGYSGGGPYALAAAYRLSQRVSKVAVISSLSPPVLGGKYTVTEGMSSLSKFGYWLARHLPFCLLLVVRLISIKAQKDIFEPSLDDFTDEENALFRANKGLRRLMAVSILELYSRNEGVRAECEDYALFARNWGFEISKVPASIPVFVYGGSFDEKCTPNMYHIIVSTCTNVSKASHLAERKGHLYFYEAFPSVLRDLGLLPH